jgi:teichuronic acid biosynthesis glycosyltransferase TuaC
LNGAVGVGSVMKVLIVTNMYPSAERPEFGSFVKDQVEALRRLGVEIDVLFVDGRSSRWNYFRGPVRYWRALLAARYDLVHAHHVLVGPIARAQTGLPVILTHHGCEALGYPRWQTVVARLITPLFTRVIYVSEEQKQALRDRAGHVIPCGIDLALFRPFPREEARARLGLTTKGRLVLWVGDPARPEKRFDLAKRAVEHAKRRTPDLELVLLSGRSHEEVPLFLSACDALLLTSFLEGSPMVVKEAMACGLPVVSVRVGDVSEVIADTPGCALADADESSLGEALSRVLAEGRRTEGRSRVEPLDAEKIARRVRDVYEETLRARRGA